MLKTNRYSAAAVVRSHIDMLTDSLNDISNITLIYDYRQAMAIRIEIDKITAELKGIWNDIHNDACGARTALLSAEEKASKLHEAAMAATSTTFDDE